MLGALSIVSLLGLAGLPPSFRGFLGLLAALRGVNDPGLVLLPVGDLQHAVITAAGLGLLFLLGPTILTVWIGALQAFVANPFGGP